MLSHSYHTKCPKECDNGASVCEPTVAWIQPAFYLTLSSTTSSRIPDAKLGEGPIIGIWRQEEMSVSGETCPGATRWKAHMHMKTHVCGFHVPAGFLSLEPSSWDSRRQGRWETLMTPESLPSTHTVRGWLWKTKWVRGPTPRCALPQAFDLTIRYHLQCSFLRTPWLNYEKQCKIKTNLTVFWVYSFFGWIFTAVLGYMFPPSPQTAG